MTEALPENRAKAIAQIEVAFSSCPRPGTDQLVSYGGIDGPCVVRNWGDFDRESVARMASFDSFYSEDLSYMSSLGLRYFLPSVLVLFLRRPKDIDFGGFISIVSRLEGLVGLRGDHEGGYYRPIALSQDQRAAIREFCGQVMTIIKKFHLGSFEEEYRQRLKALRKTLLVYPQTDDYDAELLTQSTPRENTRRTRR